MKPKFTIRITEKEAKQLASEFFRKQLGLGVEKHLEIEIYSQNGKPMNYQHSIDVGIVIALDEEFKQIFPKIKSDYDYVKEINQYFYFFDKDVGSNSGDSYRCVVTFIGNMGPEGAVLVGDRLMSRFQPATIINIGIAGAMDEEVKVGDVVIAEQADNYFATSKAVPGKGGIGFSFKLSGDPYKTSPDYVTHARNLSYAHEDALKKWYETCKKEISKQLEKNKKYELFGSGLVRDQPVVHIGHIASGPVVGGAVEFIDFLKNLRDRKFLAIEMESVGILFAAHSRRVDTLIIRGISDYSDERKKDLDRIAVIIH